MIVMDPPFFADVTCDKCSTSELRVEAEDFWEAVED